MPRAKIGEKVPYGDNVFRKLRAKGEQITLRFSGGDPYYEDKHFVQSPEDGSWDVTICPRLTTGEDCTLCAQAHALRNKANASQDKDEKEKLVKTAKAIAAKRVWYYPILDRDEGVAAILQTTEGVHKKVLAECDAEVNVSAYDYVLTQTRQPGAAYYSLVRKADETTPKLTKEEKAELKKADQLIVDYLVNPTKVKAVEEEKEEEMINVEQVAKEMDGKIEGDMTDDSMPF